MLKFNHLHRNLLVVLLMMALCPMAFQRLVTFFVPAQGFYLNADGSVSRSVRRSYGQTFLHQLNSQALENVRENVEPKSKNYVSQDFLKIRFVSQTSAKAASAVFNEKLCSSAGFIPLRI